VDSRTLAALANFGVRADALHSKPLHPFMRQRFDLLITLYSQPDSESECLPQAGNYMAWHFADPDAEDAVHAGAFAHCLQQLNERIKMLLLILTRRH